MSRRKYTQGDVKLVGGKRRYMGTVLVRYNNRWGAICDEGWDKNDANAVCKQLGYYAAASPQRGSRFGVGRKRMFLYRLDCTGNEFHIKDCPSTSFSRFWRRKCPGERRTAGVVCYPVRRRPRKLERKRPKRTTTKAPVTTTQPSVTTEANILSSTRAEHIKIKTTSRRVPTSTFTPTSSLMMVTEETKETLLRPMAAANQNTVTDLNSGESTESISGAGSSYEVENVENETEKKNDTSALMKMDDGVSIEEVDAEYKPHVQGVKSDSPDASVNYPVPYSMIAEPESDKSKEKEAHEPSEKENNVEGGAKKDESKETVMGVQESVQKVSKKNETKVEKAEKTSIEKMVEKFVKDQKDIPLSDAPKPLKMEVRIKGGRYSNEGYVLVRVNNGEWGTICSDHWTLRETRVVCNQLNTLGEGKQSLQASFFGGTEETKIFYRFKCVGREKNISECNFTKADDQNVCSKKTAVAGVTCSKKSSEKQWEDLDSKIILKIDSLLVKSILEHKLAIFSDIVYQTCLDTFGAKQHQTKCPPQRSRRQLQMDTLRKQKRKLKKQIRAASSEETNGLLVIWPQLKARHSALSRAESARKKRSQKRKNQERFIRDPFQFAR
ncbi:retinal homeobox protein rx2-like [Plakobranchus ocellatus]|uniref:Retinal homeobox protein rx2-like n=1 Tax=Plakobranchus ocellatus TaxID=259542 RepID=A0AAV4BZV5_9GAST|nr:retinal homeobox protein rx2-like [Plakobranchus ocellatus]